MKLCPFCYTESSSESDFCSGCGARLEDAVNNNALASAEGKAGAPIADSAPKEELFAPTSFPDAGVTLFAKGAVIDGRYELELMLGTGAYATVWRSKDLKTGKKVAVKVLAYTPFDEAAGEEEEAKARFLREGEICQRLNHAHIARVYAVGEVESIPYFVMEWVEGRSLRQVLNEEGRVILERAMEISLKIAWALEYTHRLGIFHRDLKPSNILMTTENDVKLTDFGIAKVLDDVGGEGRLTRPGTLLGTLEYIAPEYIEKGEVNASSDVYSLGVVLYEMLCGSPPFVADTTIELMKKHLAEQPQPPSERILNVKIPPALESIVLRCLAKDPTERFASMTELITALGRVAARLEGPENLIGKQFRDYEIVELIGAGGMAAVYKARHTRLGSLRAIKVIRKELTAQPNFYERFRTEAQIAENLRHPSLAILHEFSQTDEGVVYAVWEYVEGETLKKILEKQKTLPLDTAGEIIRQATEGLIVAHKHRIYHRDIAPDNIIILRSDADEIRVKVIDFGIAKFVRGGEKLETDYRSFLGKVGYCAPEQIGNLRGGEVLDGRCDIFSIGVVMYEMLTGEKLFKSSSFFSYVKELAFFDPSAIKMPPNTPVKIKELIVRSLQPDREKRHLAMDEFLTALDAATALPAKEAPPKTAPSAKVVPTDKAAKIETAPFKPPSPSEVVSIDLKNTSLPSFFGNLARKKKTGVVYFSFDVHRFDIYLEDGFIINVSGEGAKQIRDIGGLVSVFQFFRSHPEPRCAFGALPVGSVPKAFLIPPAKLVFAICQNEDISRVRPAFLKLKETLRLAMSITDIAKQITLSPEAGYLLTLVDATPTLDELLKSSRLTEEETYKLLICLVWLGIIRATKYEPEWLDMDIIEHSKEQESLLSKEEETHKARILEFYKKIKSTTGPAEILNIDSTAVEAQVRSAYDAILKDFGKKQVPHSLRKSLQHELSVIEMKVSEAYLLMLNRTMGSRAEEQIVADVSGDWTAVRASAIKSKKEKEEADKKRLAETYYDKAIQAFRKNDLWESLQLIDTAIKANPERGDFFLLQGRVRVKNPRWTHQAIASFEKAVELDPNNEDARIELAKFYLSKGMRIRAKAELEEALKVAPRSKETKNLLEEIRKLK